MLFRLAIKNLLHAGLRTWLNVVSLAIVFVTILIVHGFYTGIFSRIEDNMVKYDVAGGQYWSKDYDPYDIFGIDTNYSDYSSFSSEIDKGDAVPILVRSGYVYSDANMQGILIKGIDPQQTLLDMPTDILSEDTGELTAFVGHFMAQQLNIGEGDVVMLRFRDRNGANNAVEAHIAKVVHFPIQSIDIGQIWVNLSSLQELTDMKNMATTVTVRQKGAQSIGEWSYRGMDVLLNSLHTWKAQETTGAYFVMALLLGMAVLAIFDTQMLAIFRRKKEIGTLVALGMKKQRVVWLFTLEGLLYSVFGIMIGAIPGLPFLYSLSKKGVIVGNAMEGFGMNIDNQIWPEYSWPVILSVIFIVVILDVLVSYLAARRIAGMNINHILKGK